METPLLPGGNFCRVFPGEEVQRVRVRVRKLESSITAVIRRFESRRAGLARTFCNDEANVGK